MIQLIIATAFLAVLALIWWPKNMRAGDAVPATAFATVVGFMLFMVGSLPFVKVEDSRTNHTQRIYSIRGKDSVHGSFFLGSGGFGQSEHFVLFAEERGGLRRVTLLAMECFIFQNETNAPHMDWQTIVYRPSKWIALWPILKPTTETMRDVYVPPNTVIEKFTLE